MVVPTLVLLHALGASGGAWAEVTALLGDRYACSAPDLPGFGEEPALPGGVATTLDRLAAEIARLSPAAYLLVGHSMGGKFATLLAARAEAGESGLVGLAGVVLLAGSPPSPEPMDEARRAEMVGWFADGPPSDADARRFVAANVAHPLSVELEAKAIADVRRTSPAAWIDWLEHGAREDWSDRVGRLSTPALIVAGAEDGDLGEASQRRLNVPHFTSPRVAVVPRAAHLLPYEQPEAVVRLIDEAARAWLPEPPRDPARLPATTRSMHMSIEGKAKEAAGFVKEELNEHGDTPEAKLKAQEGRDLRNEGRVEDGKAPKTTEPGTGHKES